MTQATVMCQLGLGVATGPLNGFLVTPWHSSALVGTLGTGSAASTGSAPGPPTRWRGVRARVGEVAAREPLRRILAVAEDPLLLSLWTSEPTSRWAVHPRAPGARGSPTGSPPRTGWLIPIVGRPRTPEHAWRCGRSRRRRIASVKLEYVLA
jgi:hypothetical protein